MKLPLPAIFAVAATLLPGCSPERRETTIDEMRVVDGRPPRLGANSADRFGSSRMPPAPVPAAAASFAYDLPAGWRELPLKQFREVNLEAPGGVAAWVTQMGPAVPGAHDQMTNLARWFGQLGLAVPNAADLEELPRIALLGEEAIRVDLTAADGSTRLVGLMMFAPDRSVFVRMQGAPDAVAGQLAGLDAFRASLRDATGPRGSVPPSGGDAGDAGGADGFAWQRPASWADVGPGPGKVFEFSVGDARSWLTVLSSDGGGLAANVVRWAGQVGQPPPSAAQIEALPSLDVLGRPSPYVQLLAPDDGVGLLGVIVPLDGRTLFVKLQGSSSVLRARQAEFEAFCASLTIKE